MYEESYENELYITLRQIVVETNCSVALIIATATKTIPNEIGGEFAGQIYAYSNSISNISGVVCPSILGYLLDQVMFKFFSSKLRHNVTLI